MGKKCAYPPDAAAAGADAHIGPYARFPACCFFSLRWGLRPPGASSFRSCGKKRKKGTPKGRAFYKAALPFGIPSSEDCFPAAPYAAVRAASLRSARAIAVQRGMSEDGLHRELVCGYAEATPPVILSEAKNLVANLLKILRRLRSSE